MEGSLDGIDRKLLDVVQADARLSFREIGRRVGMSTPAVSEHIRRLEAADRVAHRLERVAASARGPTFWVVCFWRLKSAGLSRRASASFECGVLVPVCVSFFYTAVLLLLSSCKHPARRSDVDADHCGV